MKQNQFLTVGVASQFGQLQELTRKSYMERMRIAILGTRGIPARYGGFETFAAELSRRLSERKHEVSIYCRKHLFSGEDNHQSNGVNRIMLPAIRSKHLETLSHTFLSVLHVMKLRVFDRAASPDVVVLCNGANAPLVPLLRLVGVKVLLNVDGIERKRRKWGLAGAIWYRIGEFCAVRFPNVVISDADVIAEYYKSSHGAKSEVITYGFDDSREEEVGERLKGKPLAGISNTLEKFDLTAGNYILYVSRLEPENNCHQVLKAYRVLLERGLDTSLGLMPELVIVGNAPYADEYIQGLRVEASKGVKFLGFQFGQVYRDLMLGAKAYVQATEIGGTHPALVESMGFGNIVIANKTPENVEVLGDSGLIYDFNSPNSLADKLFIALESTIKDPSISEQNSLNQKARNRAVERYSWNSVVDKYELISSLR